MRRVLRTVLTAALCLRLWVTRTPVVRTWHNLDRPPGLGRVDHLLLTAIDRITTLRITLNDHTPVPPGVASETISHGHYRDWFADYPRRDPQPGRLLFVGRVKAYKGIEHLVDVFSRIEDEELRLHVAGLPVSTEVAQEISRLAAADPRVTLCLEYIDDARFVEEVSSAQLVVLPYRFMHNSGAILAALSLDRPVLAPDNEVNRSLAQEVGPGWVHLYDGELQPDDVEQTLKRVGNEAPEARPDLSRREWDVDGRAHADAFRRAVARAG